MIKKIKKNKGFVLLFAVTLAAIFLSIALGIGSVALQEINFSTSAKNTNDAFFAADTGVECALYWDKIGDFVSGTPTGNLQCNNVTFTGTENPSSYWSFVIPGLDSGGQGCAKVTVDKTGSSVTSITASGYNQGGGSGGCSPGPNNVERVLNSTYNTAVSWTFCANENGTCSFSGTHQVRFGANKNGTDYYNYQTVTNSIPCNYDVFGDPLPGTVKHCDYSNSTTSSPSDGTGGTITHSGGYTIQTFTSSGTFNPGSSVNSVEVLVVAGGGGGGGRHGGGGGAGGLIYNSSFAVSAQDYAVTVGSGGVGGDYLNGGLLPAGKGGNGGNSTFSTLTAIGGGGGSTYDGSGSVGGSGGGGAGVNSTSGVAGTSGQGNAGGNGGSIPSGGGGGGIGAPGSNATSNGGSGGAGSAYSISGSSVYYAGGGGGGGASSYESGGGTGGAGGVGGGGHGGDYGTNTNQTAGTANTGGGGGGDRSWNNELGSPGGSGIVIIAYPTP